MTRINIVDNPVTGEVIHAATMAAVITDIQDDESKLDIDTAGIATEVSRAEAAEAGRATTSALSTETTRAEGVEATNATAVSTEAARAQAAEAAKASAAGLTAETTRAQNAESTDLAAVTTETTRAEAAETTKATTTALNTEVARAEAEEASLPTIGYVIAYSAPKLTPTTVKNNAYQAIAGDLIPVDTTSNTVPITLPATSSAVTVVGIKSVSGGVTAGSMSLVNNITLICSGSDVFNAAGGSTSISMSLLHQCNTLIGQNGVWIPQDGLPLSALDARYATPGAIAASALVTTTQQSGTAYTFALADGGTVVESTASAATTFTIPAHSSVAFPTGTVIEVFQAGTGALSIAAASGVTIGTAGSQAMRAQYGTMSLRCRATDVWALSGDSA